MKINSKTFINLGIIVFILISFAFAIFGTNIGPTITYAAENTNIYTLANTRTIKHKRLSGNATAYLDYSEVDYYDTGIMIYSISNNATTIADKEIKSNSSTIILDFTYANDVTKSLINPYYSFEIFDSNNIRVWSAIQNVETETIQNGDTTSTKYTLIQSINDKIEEFEDIQSYNATLIGKHIINLPNGNYKIKNVTARDYFSFTQIIYGYAVYTETAVTYGNLLVDSIKPTISLKGLSSGQEIINESFINEKIEIVSKDKNSTYIYCKGPTSSEFVKTTQDTILENEQTGWYYVYVQDEVGNQSEIVSFYYDNIKPIGKFFSNGNEIDNGSYLNKSFVFMPNDSESGVKEVYYKTPISGSFQIYSGTVITTDFGDGLYEFYVVDNAGNSSEIYSINLETQEPMFEFYRNSQLVFNQLISSDGSFDTDIYLNRNDIFKFKCDTTTGSIKSNLTVDENTVLDERFENNLLSIVVETSVGTTSEFIFHIVDQKPTLIINDKICETNSVLHFNQDTEIKFFCDEFIVDTKQTGMLIEVDGESEFISYKDSNQKILTTATNTLTKYSLTLDDRAGNESKYTIIIDKQGPIGNWKIDGQVVNNNGKTNKDISFEFDENLKATYTLNGTEAKEYVSGQTLTAEGFYVISLINELGNSNTFNFQIDKTAPTLELGGVQNGETSYTSVTITNLSEEGTIEVYKDNELIEYRLGDELTEYGEYIIKVTDDLGNERQYSFSLKYRMNTGAVALVVLLIFAGIGIAIFVVFKKRRIFGK